MDSVLFDIIIIITVFVLSFSAIYPPIMYDLHPPGLTTKIPVGQMPAGKAIVYGPEH